MNAIEYLNKKYPHSHTIPITIAADEMENYWQHRKELYEKAKAEFNSEQFLSQHNLEQLRQKFKKDKDQP